MADFNMSREAWNAAIDNYIKEENEKIGKFRPVGPDIPNSWPQVHKLITEECIRDFAWNMGNTNPLYTNPEYAKNSCWGGVIAPQGRFINYIAEIGNLARGNHVPGQTHLYGGTTYEYFDVMRAGDTYTIKDEYLGVVEKQLSPEKVKRYRLLIMKAKRHYINQNGVTVVTGTGEVAITCVYPSDISNDGKSMVFSKAEKTHYNDSILTPIHEYYEKYYQNNGLQGAKPQYWEDINIGDKLPVLTKGPIDIIDIVGFQSAISAQIGGGATKWEILRAGLSARNPETGEYIPRIAFHYDDNFARLMGHPAALIYAAMHEAYISEAISNWMGDSGFIKNLSHRHRKPSYHGDIIRTEGTITKKYVENNEHLIEIKISTLNQHNIELCPSTAIVKLPSKSQEVTNV